jgi:hypothetical protein
MDRESNGHEAPLVRHADLRRDWRVRWLHLHTNGNQSRSAKRSEVSGATEYVDDDVS